MTATIMHNDQHERVLFFVIYFYDGNDENNPFDVGVRMVFIVGESVATMLLYGNFDQAGEISISKVEISVAGLSDFRNEEASSALVTMAMELMRDYIYSNVIEGVGVAPRDWLNLNSLLVNPIQYPFTVGVDDPTIMN